MTDGDGVRRLGGAGVLPRIGLLAIALALAYTGISWIMLRMMGMTGVVMVAGASIGIVVTMILLVKYPVVVCMVWFLSMSGMQTIGMLRMPGLPDFSLARLFMVLIIILGPLGIVMGRSAFRPPFNADMLMIVHAIYVLLNLYTIGNPDRFNTWIASSVAPVVGFLFAKQYIAEEKHLKIFVGFFALISVYFWITCFGEKFNIPSIVWPRAILDRDIGIPWFGRSRGPFMQPGLTGQFLGWYMMAQVFLLTRKIPISWKAVLVANIGLCSIGLLFTFTRGAWLATVVGFAAMALLRPQYRRVLLVVGVLGAVLFSTSFLQPADDEFLEDRLNNTSTIENRLGFMAAASRMIQEKPFFGVGYFRYKEIAPLYIRGTHIPFYGYVSRSSGEDVSIHDNLIGRAAEEGLFSVGLFIAIMGIFYRSFVKRWRTTGAGTWFDRDFLALCMGIMVSYIVNGMTLDYRYFDLVNVVPYFLAGIVIGYPRMIARPGAGEAMPPPIEARHA